MANHVSYSVRFEEMNDAAKAKWKELSDRLVKENYEYWMGDLWVYKDGPVNSEDVREYSWTTEHVGPKWCYIQDFDEEGFSGYSAWSAPEPALQWILDQMSELDPNMITSFYYDDEMPNFYGAYVYEGNECYDGFEDDYDDMMERVWVQYPHLKEKWDADEEDFKDEESEEEFRDVMYEVIHDAQSEEVAQAIQYIKENRESE